MTTEYSVEAVRSILRREKACSYNELVDRNYQENQITQGTYQAFLQLKEQGLADKRLNPVPSLKPLCVNFLYPLDIPSIEVDQTIEEKAQLMAQHYNLSESIGRHAEKLVITVCEDLNYTAIENRKESHNGMGLGHRDIDVFAKHPERDYYQAIEVRNRREDIKAPYLDDIFQKVSDGSRSWEIEVRPAIVARFASARIRERAASMDIPVALLGKQVVPEQYRELYEMLNVRIALDVDITDEPPQVLKRNFYEYIYRRVYLADQRHPEPPSPLD